MAQAAPNAAAPLACGSRRSLSNRSDSLINPGYRATLQGVPPHQPRTSFGRRDYPISLVDPTVHFVRLSNFANLSESSPVMSFRGVRAARDSVRRRHRRPTCGSSRVTTAPDSMARSCFCAPTAAEALRRPAAYRGEDSVASHDKHGVAAFPRNPTGDSVEVDCSTAAILVFAPSPRPSSPHCGKNFSMLARGCLRSWGI